MNGRTKWMALGASAALAWTLGCGGGGGSSGSGGGSTGSGDVGGGSGGDGGSGSSHEGGDVTTLDAEPSP